MGPLYDAFLLAITLALVVVMLRVEKLESEVRSIKRSRAVPVPPSTEE